MNDYKLLNRIKEEMGRGKAEEEIRAALLQEGYYHGEVESAFNVILHPIESELLKKPLDSKISRPDQNFQPLVAKENSDKKSVSEYKYFDFRNIFSQTWNAYIKNVGKILLFSLPLVFYKFFIISSFVPNIFDRAQLNAALFSGGVKGLIGIFFLSLVLLLMNAIVSGAIIYLAIGQRSIFLSLRDSFAVVWKLIALNIAIYAITALGLFFFVAPGILFALWSFPAWYLVIRDKLGPYQALKKCGEY
ncbi:MAG TPA: hypothetical protein PKM84_03250, partial [Candidatus Pacearchaeota archaeon]|nr:hypothetical protein [Candidatus Pacearchaeota archaeon]